MSRPRIDYFFTMVSPWSYLGHGRLLDLAARHGAEVAFKPFDTGAVFTASGAFRSSSARPSARPIAWSSCSAGGVRWAWN